MAVHVLAAANSLEDSQVTRVKLFERVAEDRKPFVGEQHELQHVWALDENGYLRRCESSAAAND